MRAAIAALGALALVACGKAPPSPDAPPAQATPPQTAAMRAYAAAGARMHGDMTEIDPDPDIAFMRGMAAHHRGAIEMAQVALRYGRDAEVRALARQVIADQSREIASMERWLAARGQSRPAATHSPAHH